MEIALEFVEVPVRCTVEIGRNGVPDRFAAILGDNSRCLLQHQRRAVSPAEHDPRMAALTIGDDHRQRAGEFTRLSAQLQITPAGFRRQPWNAYAFDYLVRGKRCLEYPGHKLGASDRPPPIGAA